MRPLVASSSLIFVAGQRGSGKSYWVKRYISGLTRVLVYDTLGEYLDIKPRFNNKADLLTYVNIWKNSSFCEAVFESVAPQEDIGIFCRIALAAGNLWVVIEELDAYCTPFKMPLELQKLIKYGRHYGISLIGISRRPSEVHRLFTSQCNRFVVFRQLEGRDIEYWRSQIGDAASDLEKLKTLPRHYIDVDFNDLQSFQTSLKKPLK